MTEHEIDDSFASFICNQFDPEYDFKSKAKALSRDTRLTPSKKYTNIDQQYKELNEYQRSETFKNVNRAKNLLSDKWEITDNQLETVMRTNYGLSDSEINDLVKGLNNDSEVTIRKNPYTRQVKIGLK